MAQAKDTDPVVFDRVSKDKMEQTPFLDKQMLYVNDSNALNYSTNQIVFETNSLSSSGRWIDYGGDAYFSFPVYETATSTGPGHNFAGNGPNDIRADYLLALKSGAWNLIHSLQIDYNGSNIVAPNGFINLLATFNALTTFSAEDVRRLNSSIFFLPDTEDSWHYSPGVNTAGGVGLSNCNNCPQFNNPVSRGEAVARCFRGNSGMLERQKSEALHQLSLPFDPSFPTGASRELMADATQTTQYVGRSLENIANPGIYIKRVYACVRLKDIHPLFDCLPLLRMANLKITLNMNNTAFVVTKTGHASAFNAALVPATGPVMSLASAPIMAGGTNPMLIASSFGVGAFNASAGACVFSNADFQITCSISVGAITYQPHRTACGDNTGFAQACRLYVPAYQMLPQFTSQYLSMGSKKVEFLDHLCVQVKADGPGMFTNMLTPSLRGIQRIVVVPHLNQASHVTTAIPFSQISSPFFDGTAPLVGGGLSQLNVRLSGLDVVQGGGLRYGYEQFRSQILNCGINGGQTSGLSSGLINEKMWLKGPFQYYCIDCSRGPVEQQVVSQSVELIGNNVSTVGLLLYVFIVYKREITVDIATGAQLA